jgi:acid phosphatase (class A)
MLRTSYFGLFLAACFLLVPLASSAEETQTPAANTTQTQTEAPQQPLMPLPPGMMPPGVMPPMAPPLVDSPAMANRIQLPQGYYLINHPVTVKLLTTPPAENSDAWKEQIEQVVKANRKVSEQDLSAIQNERSMHPLLMTYLLGDNIVPERLPFLFKLLDQLKQDCDFQSMVAKVTWNTKRPHLLDERVEPLLPPLQNGAYPSGHTIQAVVWAEVLGTLFPGKKDALRARADEIAWHRVQAGFHYPVDLEGGKEMAYLILGALWQQPQFHVDLWRVRQELLKNEVVPASTYDIKPVPEAAEEPTN